MDFIFGPDQNQSANSKSKTKELNTQIIIKDKQTNPKQLTPLQQFKLQAKKKLQNQQNHTILHQPNVTLNNQQNSKNQTNKLQISSPQNQIKTAQFHQSFQFSQHQNQFPSQNQFQNLKFQQKTEKLSKIQQKQTTNLNEAKRQQNKSPTIPKKSNQLKVSLKPPVLKPSTQKIKSVKQISPNKIQKQVKPIKSAKQISPLLNKKQSYQKPKQNKKIVQIQNKNSNQGQLIEQNKKSFSIEVKPKSHKISEKKKFEKVQNIQKTPFLTKSKEKTRKMQNIDNKSIDLKDVKSQLQVQLSHSEKGMRFLDKKLIGDKLSDSENVVYTALVSEKPDQYVKGVYQNIEPDNQFIKQGVDETVNNAIQKISHIFTENSQKNSRLNLQKRIAPRNKDDLKELQKMDKFRMIKIREGQVKDKVGDLKTQMEKQYFIHKNLIKIDPTDSIMPDYYSIDHLQTKKAQNLIRSIKKRRISQHRQYQQYLNQKDLEKQRISQIQKEYQQKFKEERKQKLKEFYEQKHQQRQLQKQEQKRKQEEFKEWIKMYEREKPLQEKFQEQMVRKIIIPEIQDRHKKLMKIKEDHKPIDIEEINQHEKRYMDFKKDEMIRQRAQLQSKIQNDSIYQEQSNRYYKGKYRYLVLESMYEQKNQTDPKQIERSKKQRQLAYSDQIRYVHQSIIRKKNEQQEDTRTLVRRVRNHNGSVDINKNSRTIELQAGNETDRPKRNAETIDVYAQGLKNLQYAKKHVREKLMNGEVKKPKIELVQVRQKHSYLDELKQKRSHNSVPHKNYSIQNNNSSLIYKKSKGNDLSTTNDLESLKARVNGIDMKLKRKEEKNKFVRDHKSLMDRQIEHDYLDSINAKLKMVQQLK